MAWVPLFSKYTDGVEVTLSGEGYGVDYSSSRIDAASGGTYWTLYFGALAEEALGALRVRITVESYTATGTSPGNQYRAARFSYGDGMYVQNLAAPLTIPGPDVNGYFGDPPESVEFSPSPIEFNEEAWNEGSRLTYSFSTETGDMETCGEAYMMLLEVWDEGTDPETGCFWTDFVACYEDCSGDVPPEPSGERAYYNGTRIVSDSWAVYGEYISSMTFDGVAFSPDGDTEAGLMFWGTAPLGDTAEMAWADPDTEEPRAQSIDVTTIPGAPVFMASSYGPGLKLWDYNFLPRGWGSFTEDLGPIYVTLYGTSTGNALIFEWDDDAGDGGYILTDDAGLGREEYMGVHRAYLDHSGGWQGDVIYAAWATN